MKLQIGLEKDKIFSSSASLLLHIASLFLVIIILNETSDKPHAGRGFIQITSDDYLQSQTSSQNGKDNFTSRNNESSIKKVDEEKKILDKTNETEANQSFYNFSNFPVDTTSLDQVYHESTLDVTLRYPNGWTYVDSDVKNKLDGVTFWFTQTNIYPPPYVHLEVEDKDLFDPQRYKHKTEINGYDVYFNDPQELEGQISQTIYIHTNSDQDYSLKLIMEGKQAFNAFQPVFFGMVKSFKFGKSLF